MRGKKMNQNEIIHRIVLGFLDTEPDYMTFIEAFPDDEFDNYVEDDSKLQELYQLALNRVREFKYLYNMLYRERENT